MLISEHSHVVLNGFIFFIINEVFIDIMCFLYSLFVCLFICLSFESLNVFGKYLHLHYAANARSRVVHEQQE